MASISPVMMKVSGFPLITEVVTVVSSVLGKQVSNRTASGLSFSFFLVWVMTCSMAGLINLRSLTGGRPDFTSALAPPAAASAAIATSTSRLFSIITIPGYWPLATIVTKDGSGVKTIPV